MVPGSLLAEVEDELAGESALVQEGDYDNFMLGDAFDGDEEPLPKPASEPAVVPAEPAEGRRWRRNDGGWRTRDG